MSQAIPTPEGIDDATSHGLSELDRILPGIVASLPDLRLIVIEYTRDGVRVCYGMGPNCVPVLLEQPKRGA